MGHTVFLPLLTGVNSASTWLGAALLGGIGSAGRGVSVVEVVAPLP